MANYFPVEAFKVISSIFWFIIFLGLANAAKSFEKSKLLLRPNGLKFSKASSPHYENLV